MVWHNPPSQHGYWNSTRINNIKGIGAHLSKAYPKNWKVCNQSEVPLMQLSGTQSCRWPLIWPPFNMGACTSLAAGCRIMRCNWSFWNPRQLALNAARGKWDQSDVWSIDSIRGNLKLNKSSCLGPRRIHQVTQLLGGLASLHAYNCAPHSAVPFSSSLNLCTTCTAVLVGWVHQLTQDLPPSDPVQFQPWTLNKNIFTWEDSSIWHPAGWIPQTWNTWVADKTAGSVPLVWHWSSQRAWHSQAQHIRLGVYSKE